jgi:hypothetical protein
MAQRPRSVLFAVLALVLASHAAFARETRRYSVPINRPQVRAHIEKNLFDGQKLVLANKLDPARLEHGVTARAAAKAVETRNGFGNFNWGAKGDNYVVSAGGNHQKWLVTSMTMSDGTGKQLEYFVARTAKNGIVVARGHIDAGQIVYTRSKNERGRHTPSERNWASLP